VVLVACSRGTTVAVPVAATTDSAVPQRSIRRDVSVALAPWLGSSPEPSAPSARSWQRSAAKRSGSGFETKSAKAACNPPASISGNLFRSSVRRRIATGLEQRTFPPQFCVLDRKCASVGLVPPIAPGLLVSLIAGKAVARHGGAGRTQVVGDTRCQVSSDEDLRRAESHSRMATQADGRNQTHSYSLV
jgi:hypothetical protein